MLSLNQLIQTIKTKAESHAQINTFYFGDPWEFGASGSILYPFCGSVLVTSALNGTILTTTIKLFICDLVNKDESNETEVLSDSRQTLLDLYSMIRDYFITNELGVMMADSVTITNFTERFDDEVSGVEADIIIEQFYNRDTCQIPLKTT